MLLGTKAGACNNSIIYSAVSARRRQVRATQVDSLQKGLF